MTENSVTDRGKIRVAAARWTERQDGRNKGRHDSTIPTTPGCALVVAAIAVLAVIL